MNCEQSEYGRGGRIPRVAQLARLVEGDAAAAVLVELKARARLVELLALSTWILTALMSAVPARGIG